MLQPWDSHLNWLPKMPLYPGCRLVQQSNLALGHGPEMRSPAPVMCGEGKGHPEVYGRNWLQAHENSSAVHRTTFRIAGSALGTSVDYLKHRKRPLADAAR
jgi:hypothetical protein